MMEVINALKSLVEAAAIKHNVDMVALLGSVLNYLCFEFDLGDGITVEDQLGDAVEITDSQADQIMRALGVLGTLAVRSKPTRVPKAGIVPALLFYRGRRARYARRV